MKKNYKHHRHMHDEIGRLGEVIDIHFYRSLSNDLFIKFLMNMQLYGYEVDIEPIPYMDKEMCEIYLKWHGFKVEWDSEHPINNRETDYKIRTDMYMTAGDRLNEYILDQIASCDMSFNIRVDKKLRKMKINAYAYDSLYCVTPISLYPLLEKLTA